MRRSLTALTIAFSLVAGTIQTAPASAQGPEESSFSSLSSSEEDNSTGAVVTLTAVTALLAAGSLWAVQQGLVPNPLPGVIPGPPPSSPAPAPVPPRGDCSPHAFNGALWEWRDSNRTRVEYCDGRFAWVAQSQTDWRVAFEFDGQRWKVSQPAGTTKTGMTQGCYNGIELRNKGVSDDFLSRLPICTPDEIGHSPW